MSERKRIVMWHLFDECCYCHAPSGQPCLNMNTKDGSTNATPHMQRAKRGTTAEAERAAHTAAVQREQRQQYIAVATTAERLSALERHNEVLTNMITALLRSQEGLAEHSMAIIDTLNETRDRLGTLDEVVGRMQRARIDEALERIGTWTDKADFEQSLADVQDLV